MAEGVATALSVHQLAQRLNLDLPICAAVCRVVHEGQSVKDALADLQARPLRREVEDVPWAKP